MKQKFKPVLVGQPDVHLKLVPGASDENAALAQPSYELKDLQTQGPNLPVGIVVNGQRSRLFRMRPFKLKQEKALSKLKDEAKGGTVGNFVSEALSLMVQTLGPHNFDAMREGERQLQIAQLTMPDVLYLWVYMRHEALGEEPVRMRITCPACSNQFDWYGELGTMDVRVVPDDAKSTMKTYKLRDGIDFAGGIRHVLQLDLIKWNYFVSKNFADKNSQAALAILGSVVGVEGVERTPFYMSETDMDEMSKYDVEGLTSFIEQLTPGPQFDIEPQCPGCNAKSRMSMNWSYDNFFSRSVLPTHTTS